MQLFSIYKSTNKINRKCYIGFDSNWPQRKFNHKSKAKIGIVTHFYNAIRKYGWDNFEWEVLCQSLDKDYTLNILEPHFIDYYDSYNNGYNMSIGGGFSMKGLKVSDETRQKISQIAKARTLNPMYGKKHTMMTRNLISEKLKAFSKLRPRIWVSFGNESKLIFKDQLEVYLEQGYLPGRTKKKKI